MALFDELKAIGKTLQEAGKIELYGQVLGVQEKLMEIQKRLFTLENENRQLKEKLEIKGSLFFENNAYWTKEGDNKNGPYCSCCWDNDKKVIHMQPCGNPAYFDCPKCRNHSVQIYPDKSEYSQEPEEDFNPFAIF
jgi:hypothetical protein